MQPDYLLMADELSELQIQSLGLALEALEEDLIELLAATEEGAKPVDLRTNKGRLSRMDEMHNQSILLANRTLTENRLRETRRARARLAAGDFGYCLDCGEPVGFARLQAYPDTLRCLACQSAEESQD